MGYTRMYLWVEGPDDERLIDGIIKPIFEEKYDSVQIVKYAEETKKKINDYLKSIKAMKADYIFFTDNDSPCVTAEKKKTKVRYRQIDEERILVVVKEIEGWYLAGLDDKSSQSLRIRSLDTTDALNKEQFNAYIPAKFDSRIDFMLEIIKCFVIQIAMTKNQSFRYFIEEFADK